MWDLVDTDGKLAGEVIVRSWRGAFERLARRFIFFEVAEATSVAALQQIDRAAFGPWDAAFCVMLGEFARVDLAGRVEVDEDAKGPARLLPVQVLPAARRIERAVDEVVVLLKVVELIAAQNPHLKPEASEMLVRDAVPDGRDEAS